MITKLLDRCITKGNLHYIGLFFLLALIPLFVRDPYLLHVLIMLYLYTYLGAIWNILGGYTGQFSIGHAAFFGIGAYISTLLYIHWEISPWVGMLIGAGTSLIIGLFVGFLCFRYGIRGVYFVLLTLCFSEIARLVITNWEIFGGSNGIIIPLVGTSFWKFQFVSRIPYYYIILLMMTMIILLTHKLETSKMGEYFMAIREDEEASEALGINTLYYKLIAMGITCFTIAFGGTFYAQYTQFIQPDLCLGIGLSVEIIFGPIAGGLGTILGPLVGSSVLMVFSEISRVTIGQFRGIHLMLYGLFIIFIMIYMPKGILVGIQKMYKKGS